jgi:hypothetical protein
MSVITPRDARTFAPPRNREDQSHRRRRGFGAKMRYFPAHAHGIPLPTATPQSRHRTKWIEASKRGRP